MAPTREIGVGGRDAGAVAGAHRHPPGADGTRPIVIVDQRETGARQGIETGRRDLGELHVGVARDGDRAAVAVPRLIAELGVGLEPREVREHVVEAPAGIAQRGPSVVVGGRSAQREPRLP